MNRFLARNLKPLLVMTLLISIGYCFLGKIGIGIALILVMIAQLV